MAKKNNAVSVEMKVSKVTKNTARFGAGEILYEGDLAGCLRYIHRHGIKSYKASF